MTEMIRELDVRPLLQSGGEPFPAIMEAVAGSPPVRRCDYTPPSGRFRCSR